MSVKRIIKLDRGDGNSISIEIEEGLETSTVYVTEGYLVTASFIVKNEDLSDFGYAINNIL